MEATRSPTLLDVLEKVREGIFRDLNVCMPARVERYDAAKQLVDVTPLIAGAWRESDDSVSHVPVCVIPNCPVVFPGAGGFRVTFPIQVGDTGLIVFADRSLDAWQDQGGLQAVGDLRRHDITDGFFLPGAHPNNAAWTGASTSNMTLGKDGGAQIVIKAGEIDVAGSDDTIAKGAATKAELQALWDKFNAHKHTGVTTGSGTSAVPVDITGSAGDVGSSVAKVGA